jgi:hypothetical protein
VRFAGIGAADPDVGPPTQMAVFSRAVPIVGEDAA